jgi:hypothetical protein
MTKQSRRATVRVAGLAAVCAVALPAAASAASGTSIVAGPLKVKDYSMTVTANDGAQDSLSVMFSRRAGQATQTHFYTFSDGVQVTANKRMSSARVKANLGRYGAVNLRLTGVAPAKRGTTPKGCTGKAGTLRRGTFKGAFKLVADATYFKTVSAKSLKAQLARGGAFKCGDGPSDPSAGGGAGETMLTSSSAGSDGLLMVTMIRDAKGAVTQQAMRSDDDAQTAPASIMHMINAPGPASAFAPSADLSSATGSGVAPFFSGSFDFASEEPMAGMASGTLNGDLAARFDSIGTQPLAAGADAMLMKR